jgi:hypothetical protein
VGNDLTSSDRSVFTLLPITNGGRYIFSVQVSIYELENIVESRQSQ